MKKILMLAVIMFSTISMFGIGHRNDFNRVKDIDYELLDSLKDAGYVMLPEVIIYGTRVQDTIKCKNCKVKSCKTNDDVYFSPCKDKKENCLKDSVQMKCEMNDSLKTNDVIINNYYNDDNYFNDNYFNDDFYYSNRIRYFGFNGYFYNDWYYDPFYYNNWYRPYYYGTFGFNHYPKYSLHRKFNDFKPKRDVMFGHINRPITDGNRDLRNRKIEPQNKPRSNEQVKGQQDRQSSYVRPRMSTRSNMNNHEMGQRRMEGQQMRPEQNQTRPNTYVAPKERRNMPMNMNRSNNAPQMRNSTPPQRNTNPPAIQRSNQQRPPMNNSQRMNSSSSNTRSSGNSVQRSSSSSSTRSSGERK